MAYKTFSSVSTFPLLEVGVYDKQARKASYHSSGGDMGMYVQTYTAQRRKYRRHYSSTKLESLGFTPSSPGKTKILNPSAFPGFIRTNYDPNATIVTEYVLAGHPDVDNTAKFLLQSDPEWSRLNQSITRGGVEYFYKGYLDDPVYGLGIELVATDLSSIFKSVDSPLFTSSCFTFIYESSTAPINYYISEEDDLSDSVYIIDDLDFTAIIPLKEEGVVLGESSNIRKMLKLLSLERDDLLETLENKDITNAYIHYGIPLNTKKQESLQMLYRIFNEIPSDVGKINVSVRGVSWTYQFTSVKVDSVSVDGVPGTYSSLITPGVVSIPYNLYGSASLLLRQHISSTLANTILIEQFRVVIRISGETNLYPLTVVPTDENGGYNARLMIPLDYLQDLRYKEFTVIHEESLVMLAYSETRVKLKWYQTGWFRVLMFVVAILIQMATGVPAVSLAMAFTQAVVNVLISMVVSMVVKGVVDALGLPAWVSSLLTLTYELMSGDVSGLLDSSDLFYKMADLGAGIYNVYLEHEMSEMAQDLAEFNIELEEYQEKVLELSDKWQDETGVGYYPQMPIDVDYATRPPANNSSMEAYVYSQIGSKYDEISNIYDISSVYSRKISIHSGI